MGDAELVGTARTATLERREDRAEFVARVVAELQAAGIDYVLLHERAAERRADSDLDVAVARESVGRTRSLVRSGVFGRPIQAVDYDVPWCTWYVLEARERGRRHRQIDFACDPWGIGRYGPAVRLALAGAEDTEQGRLPEPAAEAAYLALKRAAKGIHHDTERTALAASVAADPDGLTALLERELGQPLDLRAPLSAASGEAERALARLRRRVIRRRLRPRVFSRLLVYRMLRLWRRVAQPTGLVVSLVGPDGAGKSTLADGLEEALATAFRRTARLHLGPGVLPSPGRLLGRTVAGTTTPHAREPSGRAVSLLRLAYLWLDCGLGWLPRVAVPKRRTALVLLERGWSDLLVDPRRYRLSLPPGLVRALGALLPRPDLVLVLVAPASEIHARKPELDEREIERQLDAWRTLAARDPERHAVLAATSGAETLESAVEVVHDHLARRLAARSPGRGR